MSCGLGRAGVPMEVMGLMLGEFVDDYTVRVIDVFAMPQSGTVSDMYMCMYGSCSLCAYVCGYVVISVCVYTYYTYMYVFVYVHVCFMFCVCMYPSITYASLSSSHALLPHPHFVQPCSTLLITYLPPSSLSKHFPLGCLPVP